MAEKIIATFIGSVLGFGFGFVMFVIRENAEKCAALESVRGTMIFLINELERKIEHSPKEFEYINIAVLMKDLGLIVKDARLGESMEELSTYFTHWKAGNYLAKAPRVEKVIQDRERLRSIAQRLGSFEFSKSMYLTSKHLSAV